MSTSSDTSELSRTSSELSLASNELQKSISERELSETQANGKMKGRKFCRLSTILKILLACGIAAVGIAGIAIVILGVALLLLNPINLSLLSASASSIGSAFGSGLTSFIVFLAPIKIPCLVLGPTLIVMIGFGAGSYKIYCLYRARKRQKAEERSQDLNSDRSKQEGEEEQTKWHKKLLERLVPNH